MLQTIAQNASQRNSHQHQCESPQNAQRSPADRKPSIDVLSPRLPDVPDNQNPRNSVVFRRLAAANSLPSAPATTKSSGSVELWSPMNSGDYQSTQTASSEEGDGSLGIEEAKTESRPQHQSDGGRQTDVNQGVWQSIDALEQSFDRIGIASQMQEVLNYAVPIHYLGLGPQVLEDLDEVQDKARRLDMRVISGQAQLWRAIILDEMGEEDLVPELLADALLLMPAIAGYTLPITDVGPEDADFYQLWRLVLIKGYGVKLWRHLEREAANENPHQPPKDLNSTASQEEASGWAARVCDILAACFNSKKWPGPNQGRNLRRDSSPDSSSSSSSPSTAGGMCITSCAIPTQQPESPATQASTAENMALKQAVKEHKTREQEYLQTIETLKNDVDRYKAERLLFDEGLSTGNSKDAPSPYGATEKISPKSIAAAIPPPYSPGPITATNQMLRDGNSLRGIDPFTAHRHSPQEQSFVKEPDTGMKRYSTVSGLMRAKIGPCNTQPLKLAPNQRPGHVNGLGINADGQEMGYGASPDFSPGYYRGVHADNPVIRWAERAHGGRGSSSSTSALREPLSPNSIPPSEPSGKSWRQTGTSTSRSSSFRSTSGKGQGPAYAWRENNIAAKPDSSSASGFSGKASYSGDVNVHHNPESAPSSPLPDESKRVKRASEASSQNSSWLRAKGSISATSSKRDIALVHVPDDQSKPDQVARSDDKAVLLRGSLPLRQYVQKPDSSSGYGERTYNAASSSQQTSARSGSKGNTNVPLSASSRELAANGDKTATRTPPHSSPRKKATGGTEVRVRPLSSRAAAQETSPSNKPTPRMTISSSSPQQALLSRRNSDTGSIGKTRVMTSNSSSAGNDNSSPRSRTGNFLKATPASPKDKIPVSGELQPTKPNSHLPHRRPSLRLSQTSGSRNIHPRSPLAISPLSDLEVIQLTDTPSPIEIEKRRSHIREHEEQRRRSSSSSPSTSPTESSEAEVQRSLSNSTRSSQTSRISSATSITTDSAISPRTVDKEAKVSLSRDDESNSGRAHIQIAEPTSSLSSDPNGDNREDTIIASDFTEQTPPSTDRSSASTYTSQASSSQSAAQRRLSSGIRSTLKLQMPTSPMHVEHKHKSSAVPVSPSPLRTEFYPGEEERSVDVSEEAAAPKGQKVASSSGSEPKSSIPQKLSNISPKFPTSLLLTPSQPITSAHDSALHAHAEIAQPQHQHHRESSSIYEQISDAYGPVTPTSSSHVSQDISRTSGFSEKAVPIVVHARSSESLTGSWGDDEDDDDVDGEEGDDEDEDEDRDESARDGGESAGVSEGSQRGRVRLRVSAMDGVGGNGTGTERATGTSGWNAERRSRQGSDVARNF